MRYEVNSFQTYPSFELLMSFMPLDDPLSMLITVKNKFKKALEHVYFYGFDFEVTEVD